MVNHFEDVFNNDAKFAINSFIGCLKPKIRDKYREEIAELIQKQAKAIQLICTQKQKDCKGGIALS